MAKHENWILKVNTKAESYGTGFVVSPNLLVTCRHVLGEYPDQPITKWGKFKRKADWIDDIDLEGSNSSKQLQDVQSHKVHDLALLKYPDSSFRSFATIQLGVHQLQDKLVNTKLLGFPTSLNGILSDRNVNLRLASLEGVVKSSLKELLHTGDHGVCEGYSGGPILHTNLADSTVVAMIQLGGKGTGTAQYISSDCIVKFMADHGYWPSNTKYAIQSRPDNLINRQKLISDLLSIPTAFRLDSLPFVIIPPDENTPNHIDSSQTNRPFAISSVGIKLDKLLSLEMAFKRASALSEHLGLSITLSTKKQWSLACGVPGLKDRFGSELDERLDDSYINPVPHFNPPKYNEYCWVDNEHESQLTSASVALGIHGRKIQRKKDQYHKKRSNREFRLTLPLESLINLRDKSLLTEIQI